MQIRLDDILQLDGNRGEASFKNAKLQVQVKYFYDMKALEKTIELEDFILLQNTRFEDKGKHGKFDPLSIGPYLIHEKWGEDS